MAEDECPATMRGRHDAELHALKDGQARMETSLKDLTVAIKEYVVLTQELQTKRIDELERVQDKQDTAIETMQTLLITVKGKTDFTYKVIVATAGVLIVAMVGVIFGLIWSNVTAVPPAGKAAVSCTSFYVS